MTKEMGELWKLVLESIQTAIVVAGGFWAYWRFFREGTYRPRIEMDVSCDDLGVSHGFHALAFRISATNHGHKDFEFHDLRIRVMGVERERELRMMEIDTVTGKAPYLEFSEGDRKSHSIIPVRFVPYFVRPGVTQHFSYVTAVPVSWAIVLTRVSFKYPTTGQIHTAEKAFRLEAAMQNKSGRKT
ncbi:MAG: hypothetical protein A4E58_03044 [Syntrophorhabdus sp. PtaB.Bin006]|nr:MAG: hypothetical protein A4E58_03044 [Syntrophorhabdus sp. PtaB.Bin006]